MNAAQFQWAQLLAGRHRNICVVGDDDQSIYAWRGANVRIILDFEVDYPDARVIRLEQNYRSTQPILDAAHGVISKNLGRKPKRLWTEKETPISGAKVRVHGTANAQEEAAWLVRQIQLLQRERAASGRRSRNFPITRFCAASTRKVARLKKPLCARDFRCDWLERSVFTSAAK